MARTPNVASICFAAGLAQKFCYQVCSHHEFHLPSLGLPAAGPPARLRRGRGCAQCRLTGHHGRTGLFEMMPVTPALRALIHRGAGQGDILAAARKEGMRTLREAGVQQVLRGVTTVAEVLRVTMRDAE